jgi:hypothetical protein
MKEFNKSSPELVHKHTNTWQYRSILSVKSIWVHQTKRINYEYIELFYFDFLFATSSNHSYLIFHTSAEQAVFSFHLYLESARFESRPEQTLSLVPSVTPGKFRNSIQVRPRQFPSRSIQFSSLVILPSDAMLVELVIVSLSKPQTKQNLPYACPSVCTRQLKPRIYKQ